MPDCSAGQIEGNLKSKPTTYLNWYDNASPGMSADNIHILNPGTTTSTGCVSIRGGAGQILRLSYVAVGWSVDPGGETWVSLPRGTYSGGDNPGPVAIELYSGGPVLASQRVQYYSSLNELWATAAPTTLPTSASYFNWYDNASPGMLSDNIHVFNWSTATANVTISIPGVVPLTLQIAPAAEQYTSFPSGTIGGPVKVTSDQPLTVSQRVVRNQSFSEIWSQPAGSASTKSYFNWFDNISPGMSNDNIHVLNPGTVSAAVTIAKPGSPSQSGTILPGAEAYFTFPAGPYGGPVTVSSDQPVLASQRIHFYQSFSEIWAASPPIGPAGTCTNVCFTWFNWYDRASPGMYNDNLHLFNPQVNNVLVSVAMPGQPTQTFQLLPGEERYINFGNTIGGPVSITTSQALVISQRVQYYQSFNEVWAG